MAETKSLMISMVPPVRAISSAERFMNSSDLTAHSEKQKKFVEFYQKNQKAISKMPGVKGLASSSPQEIADFFKENGMAIAIPPLAHPGILIAGISDFFGVWRSEGKKATIETPYGIVKGALLKGIDKFYVINKCVVAYAEAFAVKTVEEVEAISSAEIWEETRLACYFAVVPDRPLDEYDLFQQTKELSGKVHSSKPNKLYEGLGFPTVKITAQHDMDWLNGLCLDNFPVEKSIENNDLEIDKNGFKAASGFSGSIVLGISFEKKKDPYVIKDSYLFWIEKMFRTNEELERIVVFSAYVSADDFQPADADRE